MLWLQLSSIKQQQQQQHHLDENTLTSGIILADRHAWNFYIAWTQLIVYFIRKISSTYTHTHLLWRQQHSCKCPSISIVFRIFNIDFFKTIYIYIVDCITPRAITTSWSNVKLLFFLLFSHMISDESDQHFFPGKLSLEEQFISY